MRFQEAKKRNEYILRVDSGRPGGERPLLTGMPWAGWSRSASRTGYGYEWRGLSEESLDLQAVRFPLYSVIIRTLQEESSEHRGRPEEMFIQESN